MTAEDTLKEARRQLERALEILDQHPYLASHEALSAYQTIQAARDLTDRPKPDTGAAMKGNFLNLDIAGVNARRHAATRA